MKRGAWSRGRSRSLEVRSRGVSDATLLAVIERDFETVAGRAGDLLVCRPGCDACCHGPFPITRLDVDRLRAGLDRLREREPHRAAEIERRASSAVRALEPTYPGDAASGTLAADEAALDAFFTSHRSLACPALDPRTGTCELYDARPIACRTFGPPLRFDDATSDACELCFGGAGADTIESCRLEPDRAGIEQALLERLGVRPGEEWETLIPFALAQR